MRKPLALLVSALCLTLGGCKRAASPDVAATVNNRPIAYAELDKQFQSQYGAEALKAPDDQTQATKLQVLLAMINAEIMLQRAEKQSLMASDSEVDAKFNELKAPYTQEEFQKQLAARKITEQELKTQIRRDLSVQKLINKEITSKISISDKDVAVFYEANKQSFNLAEPQFHLAQIVVTPTPGSERAEFAQQQGAERRRSAQQDPDDREAPAAERGLRDGGPELLGGSELGSERRGPGVRSRIGAREGEPGTAQDGGVPAIRPGHKDPAHRRTATAF